MKVDAITMDLRVRTVAEWILSGFATKDIIAQCAVKWQVDERMAYKYRKQAMVLFKKARQGEISERIDFYIAAKLKIFNELMDKKTPKGAAVASDILDSMARLEGAITDKLDITSKGKQIKPEVKVFEVSMEL